jgi:MFS family permease
MLRQPLPAGDFNRAYATRLWPFIALTFLGFLDLGIPLAALSGDVRERGFGTLTVAFVIGLQSLITIISRHRAGAMCDFKGPKQAVLTGLPVGAVAALFYLLSEVMAVGATVALSLLMIGRVLMGLAESLFLTGSLSWALGALGPARFWQIMALQGTAMHIGLAFGALVGRAIDNSFGFAGVSIAALIMPLVAIAFALPQQAAPCRGRIKTPARRILRVVWQPGMVLALGVVPFAGMIGFLTPAFAARDWGSAGLTLGALSLGYVATRLFFPHLPARMGIVRVMRVSLAVEAFGQLLMLLAQSPVMALAGAMLTGIGFSLIFPVMGMEVIHRFSQGKYGRAIGAYSAFFDLAMGLTVPAVALIVPSFGYFSVFFVGTVACLMAIALSSLVLDRKLAAHFPPEAMTMD